MNTWQEGRAIFCVVGPLAAFPNQGGLYTVRTRRQQWGRKGWWAVARGIWVLQKREWAQRQEMRKEEWEESGKSFHVASRPPRVQGLLRTV